LLFFNLYCEIGGIFHIQPPQITEAHVNRLRDGDESLVRSLAEEVVMDSLREFTLRARNPGAHAESLFRLCANVEFPKSKNWFSKQLRFIAKLPPLEKAHGEEPPTAWQENIASLIVDAALKQVPADNPDDRASWKTLLKHPAHSTTAIKALASDPLEYFLLLGKWWASSHPNRERELRNQLREVHAKLGARRCMRLLRQGGAVWTKSFRFEVNLAVGSLRLHGLRPPFPHSTRS